MYPMKTSVLLFAILGSVAVASAAPQDEPIALPEMKMVGSWHPALVHQVVPDYPYELRRAGEEGRVSCDLVVDREGRVKAVTVLDSDNQELSRAVIEAARQWRFIIDEKPARDVRHARVTFRFVLEESA